MLSAGVFRTCLGSAGHPTELVETLDISNADKLQAFNLIVREHKSREWREMPLAGKFGEDRRGLGVVDLAQAVRDGRAPSRQRQSGLSRAEYHTCRARRIARRTARRIDQHLRTPCADAGRRVQGWTIRGTLRMS
jgi:hypothetical protein